jgi:hypothetical protein
MDVYVVKVEEGDEIILTQADVTKLLFSPQLYSGKNMFYPNEIVSREKYLLSRCTN